MARISQETIDRIRDTADILEIVSEHVQLRRRGRNFFGLCPFHPEKTPSFSVARDKQIFHCFGCGIGGNAITFLMEYEKITFVEALQKLAGRYGIELDIQQDDRAKEFYTQLYDIHELAVKLYQKNLGSTTGKEVRAYLKKRGLRSETLDRFLIGLATKSWDQLYSSVKSKKFSEDAIRKCGLFSQSEKGFFDRFRSRLMFPITNRSKRVIAFGGRDLEGKSEAKYLNSPETPIYSKSDILYGLSETKESIREEKCVIVVEGYMDVLQLYQSGIRNVVATSGTALTERHVTQIRKFADTVFLAYDGDEAGRKAAISAGYNLLRGGLTPEVIAIPEGLDPDSWVKENGTEPFLQSKENSEDLIEFHVRHTPLDLSRPVGRSRLAEDIITEIAGIRDEIIRQHTVKQVAEKLEADDGVLVRMLAKRARSFRRPKGEDKAPEEQPLFASSMERAQMEIVKLLAGDDPEAHKLLKDHTNLDHFSHPVLKSLASYLLPRLEEDDATRLSGALDQFEKKTERDLASRVLFEATSHDDSHRVAVDCLITLEQSPLKQNIAEQRIRLRDLERKGEDLSSTLLEVVKLQQQLKELEGKRAKLLNYS